MIMTATAPPANGHARPVTLAACPQQDVAARGPDEFRIAAGLASWSPAVLRASGLLREETPPAGPPPAARWRRRQDGPGRSRTAADEHGRRWHAADGDTAIRVLAAAVVLAVAAFAAIVSYSHIFELGRHHGQDGAAARLLPLSVDGLIASASLVMLYAARRDLSVPWLARAMLVLGVGATVAANVGYGLPFGWLSAVVSAWPAVAFVGSVEMAVRLAHAARQDSAGGQDKVAPGIADSPDSGADNPGDRTADRQAPAGRTPPPPRKAVTARTGRDRAADIIRRNPGWDNAKVAGQAGCDVRTVRRARSGLAGKGTS